MILKFNMSALAEFVLIFLVQLACATVCLACSIHWIYIHYHNHNSRFFHQLGLQIILPQYLALIAYTITSWTLTIEILQHLNKHNITSNNTNDLNLHDLYNMEAGPAEDIHSYVATAFYQLGKVSNYIIMLLRLKQMLKDSIFEYSNKVYITMTCLLVCLGLDLISDYIIPLFLYSEERRLAWNITLMLWIVLDLAYYVSVSWMFLAKLREITNTYRTFVVTVSKQTGLVTASFSVESDQDDNGNSNNSCNRNNSNGSNNKNSKNNGTVNDGSREQQRSDGMGQQGTRIDRVLSTSSTSDDNDSENKKKNNNNNINSNNNNYVVVHYRKQIAEKRKIYEILSQTMKIYTMITVIIVLSSASVYFTVFVFGWVLSLPAIAFMFVSVDAAINGLCLLLYFENARIFYYKLVTKCFRLCLCGWCSDNSIHK